MILSANIHSPPMNQKTKGSSKDKDFQLSFDLNPFDLRIFYQEYQKFYVEEFKNQEGIYFQVDDLKTKHIGTKLFYLTNIDYKNGSRASDFYARQVHRNGGRFFKSTWILGTGYDYIEFKGLPEKRDIHAFNAFHGESPIVGLLTMKSAKINTLKGEIGFGLMFGYNSLYLETRYTFGPGLQFQTIKNSLEETQEFETSSQVSTIELRSGFTMGNNLFGLNIKNTNDLGPLGKATLKSSMNNLVLYWGYSL